MIRRAAMVAALVSIAGCGGGMRSAFGYQFADNSAEDMAAVLARLPAGGEAPSSQAIAVVSTHSENEAERRIVAFSLEEGRELWGAALDAETQPEILGDVVLATTREELVAFDLAGGRELWRHRLPDLGYVGAARDGDTIYWAATVGALGGARRVGLVMAMDARSGGAHWRHDIDGVFGRPVAAGGLVFVPWERQNIGVLDGENGIEIARLRSTDDVIAWAFRDPTGIYYGNRGMYRLDARSVSGTQAGSTYLRPPVGELPRQPEALMPDAFVPQPGARSARGRIRVYFAPTAGETIGVVGDTWYFAYYRYVFAYDAAGQLRWARNLEQDVLGAQALPNGLLTVGEQGRAILLDRETGNDRWMGELGAQLASVELDAAGFDPAGEVAAARSLRETLNELVLDPDNRLVAARAYAVQQLGLIEDPEVTRDLLDLYQQRSMPGALKDELRSALRVRRSGEQFLMEALARRYDYLEDTQAPPLEAIVPALLEMRHTAAVPRLVNHLMDHETPEEVLPQLVDAIVELGGVEALPALRTFVVLYHADSTFAGPVEDRAVEGGEPVRATPAARAIAAATAGIFRLGGPEGRELVTQLSTDRANEALGAHIQGFFTAEQAAEAARVAQEAQAAQAALVEQQRQVEAALPRRLTQEQIDQTFAEHTDAVRECITAEVERSPRLMQVRLVFILGADGRASELTVSPASSDLRGCLDERVRAMQFPRFTQRMMRGAFTVAVGHAVADAPDTEPAVAPIADDAPWWAWAQRRAERTGIAQAAPADGPAWWAQRAAPVRARETQVSLPEVENELPPGMVAPVAERPRQQRPVQQRPVQQQPATQEPTPPPAEGGGTPWWAGAASEDPGEEEPPPEPTPTPTPRRPRRR